jgi:hypothetical protein
MPTHSRFDLSDLDLIVESIREMKASASSEKDVIIQSSDLTPKQRLDRALRELRDTYTPPEFLE